MIRRMLSRWRPSTFVRYALSYIGLLALVLSVLIGYMCVNMDREVRQRVLDSQINRLSRIAFQHEEYLSSMLNTAEQIGLSPFIEAFSFEEEPWRAYDLIRQLAPYTVTNDFCDQIYLRFSGDDHLYSSSSSMTLGMFVNLVQYERVSDAELLSLLDETDSPRVLPAQRVVGQLVDGSGASMVTFIIPLGLSLKSSKGAMLFLLKESVYREMFSDAIEDSNNTYIFYGDEVLSSSADFELPLSAVSQALNSLEESDETLSTSFGWNGEVFNLLALGHNNWGMRYVTVLRAVDLTSTVRKSLSGILLLAIPIAGVGVLLALYLARRNMRPIRAISDMLPAPDKAGDEMASIVSGVRQLTERNTYLTDRLARSVPMQRHEFVLRFMKGRFSSRSEAVAAAAALGIAIDKAYYAVALSSVQENEEPPFDLRKPPFSAETDAIGVGVELMAMNAHLYLIFSDDDRAIRRMAERIRESALEQQDHATVAISGVQTDFSRAASAYLEAATAYDNRFVMDDSRLLVYSAASVNLQDTLPKARKITDGINHALKLNNRQMLEGKMDELLSFLKHTSMSPFAFRLIYNDVIDTLLREHDGIWAGGEDPLAIYDIFSLSGCQSIDDLDALLRRLCNSIMKAETLPEQSEIEVAPSVINQIMGYMNEHYDDPELSISAIAEAFDMSTARLSLGFKEIVRLSPLEYLTLLRVESSKKLLHQTALSVKEISQRVGYYDASSFARRFKQMTGVTPLQYRRNKEDERA